VSRKTVAENSIVGAVEKLICNRAFFPNHAPFQRSQFCVGPRKSNNNQKMMTKTNRSNGPARRRRGKLSDGKGNFEKKSCKKTAGGGRYPSEKMLFSLPAGRGGI